MTTIYPEPLQELMDCFEELPSVGPKTSQRLALHVLHKMSLDEVNRFSDALVKAKTSIRQCKVCHNLSESELCSVCANPKREAEIICVVADERDQMAIEKSGEFRGTYHVLGGLLDAMDGKGPYNLNIESLVNRVKEHPVKEVILALPPSIYGDATICYLALELKDLVPKITQIAYGIPVGGEIEYADPLTISRSLKDRHVIDN